MMERDKELRLASETEDVRIGWKKRVEFRSRGGVPVAYRPGQIVTDRVQEARDWIVRNAGSNDALREQSQQIRDTQDVIHFGEPDKAFGRLEWAPEQAPLVPDAALLVEDMRRDGFKAQLNHVYFTHCGCYPHPALWAGGGSANPAFANPAFANPAFANPAFANPAFANPAFANPAFANPAFANPAFANPAFANPAFANPYGIRSTGLRRSSARPPELDDDEAEAMAQIMAREADEGAPRVIVVDTGVAGLNEPKPLIDAHASKGIVAAENADLDQPDSDQNKVLDGAAGHGTFIAGLIRCVAPGVHVEVHRVLRTYGDGDEATIVHCLNELEPDENSILNLSFGGYVWDEPVLLAQAIRRFQNGGGVVVSSAGNDGTCQPSLPAALPDVVSVGAVGPTGPAGFTNYGPWVRACAPGVNLVSMFFTDFAGVGQPGSDGLDPDDFKGWAQWSGTSFAAPVVAAALARTMRMADCSARKAVERVVDHPALMRLPFLGTLVNVI